MMKYGFILCGFQLMYHLLVIVYSNPFSNQNFRYDKSVLLFSNQGELLQVQYARNAGLLGETVLCGISRSEEEIIICIPKNKKNYLLIDSFSEEKIVKIDQNIFFVFAGLGGDGRALINEAREFCVEIRSQFHFPPTIISVSRQISNSQHQASLMGGKRPFGVQTLLLGYSSENKQMEIFLNEPSGDSWSVNAMAIGKSSPELVTRLESKYSQQFTSMELAESFSELILDQRQITEKEIQEEEGRIGTAKDDGIGEYLDFYIIRRVGEDCQLKSFKSLAQLKAFKLNEQIKQ